MKNYAQICPYIEKGPQNLFLKYFDILIGTRYVRRGKINERLRCTRSGARML